MTFSKIALLLSVAVAASALPSPGAVTAPIEGYKVATLSWEVETSPGHIEILNGTVQEVVAQAVKINPDFEEIVAANLNAGVSVPEEKRSEHALSKRSEVNCWPRQGEWGVTPAKHIEDGISYLRGIGGKPHLLPGPGYCTRVSCSHTSAIWLCNDQNYERWLGSWNDVANSAQHIVNTCKYWAMHGTLGYYAYFVKGQNFEASKWNTIVRHDGNNC
ncbi:hypothetical protein M011DRAFT_476962 [Sporormia fimetaria CBS 119925]|uniref:Uncharacterized protein n=1 Tax=Sporormia fimetaria CBS 119925 TaxID=1340428 RepID=A0A6A6VF36_9PLEO|nr:hypothetical protein M011DRAFT_476962 [Sporormia fimetaria CBS 119925]